MRDVLQAFAAAAAGDRDGLAAARAAWDGLDEQERAVLGPVGRLLAQRLGPAAQPAQAALPLEPAPPAPPPSPADLGHDDALSALLAEHAHLTDADLAEAEEVVPPEDALAFGQRVEVPDGPREVGIPGDHDPDALLAGFGLPGFRPGQREAVQAALDGRDSLVVMPTGGGKSLCYQVPAVASDALTIVVSPLIALIADQQRRLAEVGARSVMLASTLGEEHNRAAVAAVRDGQAQVVLCAPERFASKAFRAAIARRRIGLFVIDEAHCVSEWGHDFRPDYLRLGPVLDELGRPPVMAATATATPRVAAEVVERLGLRDPLTVRRGFDRPNLSFDVLPFEGDGAVGRKRGTLLNGLAQPENLPAIVYCGTRKDTEEVAEVLRGRGLSALAYHGRTADQERTSVQQAFMRGDADVIVATNAFGMGVDKADIRSVWHWALPKSVEGYYQEAGRAGRDGAPARAVLLAMRGDLGRLTEFIRQGEIRPQDVSRFVDRLRPRGTDRVEVEVRRMGDADRTALAIAERSGALAVEPAGGGRLVVTFLAPLDLGAVGRLCRDATGRQWEAYKAIKAFAATEVCRRRQLLDHFGDDEPGRPDGRCCDVCDPVDWVQVPARGVPAKAGGRSAPAPVEVDAADEPLLEALRAWRTGASEGKPAYTVATNATLGALAAARPATRDALLAIKGVGPSFLEKWGDEVLALVAAHPRR